VMRPGGWLTALGLASSLFGCGSVPLTAPNGGTLTIEANPKSIPAVGGKSTITVIGFKSAGDGGGSLPDGTQIFFTTDLGAIEERVATENGIARATLQSDGHSGTATVTASSGTIAALTATVEVGAGTSGDLVITVTANPATLGPSDFTSEIVASVTDNRGNFLADVPVIFSTSSGALASQGSVLRTNANGQAFDRLTLLDDQGDATVTVTSGATTGSVSVTRGTFRAPLIDSVAPSSGSRGGSLTVKITGQKFQPGATASFGDGIAIDEVTFVNAETLLVDITVTAGAAAGSRTITVTNPDGGSGTFASGFTVVTTAPVCRMTVLIINSGSGTQADPWVMAPGVVDFNGTSSFDPDGGSLTFDWNVGDPPTPAFTDAAFTYSFSATDIFQVSLTVTDDEGDSCTLVRYLDVP
jgi:PKD domain/IPT/TIG domain